ncbi:MAG: hypothetical protein CFK52_14160 [Chloracidobacterium sp. CP2_5A]|nr:MAG: hypothetical protein CFK52_14160 [Chloracidobacterium sp. CP2_5A]
MILRPLPLAALLLPIALAAPALAESRSERRAAQMSAWVEAGDPQDCIQLNRIRETRVLSDQVIDFIMDNGQLFRNTLPAKCPQLGFQESFGYQTSINQLCNVDIITVIIPGIGPNTGASCGLGRFTPMKPASTAGRG